MAAHAHAHVPAGRVVGALAVTIVAATIELVAARTGNSLFLVADALHLVAHVGIFAVLLLPARGSHEAREDVVTTTVLVLVVFIAGSIGWDAARTLLATGAPPVEAAWMTVSLVGLVANLVTAWLFRDPARHRWSFRAALAHELADASMTIAGLAGAGIIATTGSHWIDPALSLVIVVWLAAWAFRLLVRRLRFGRDAWALDAENGHAHPHDAADDAHDHAHGP